MRALLTLLGTPFLAAGALSAFAYAAFRAGWAFMVEFIDSL